MNRRDFETEDDCEIYFLKPVNEYNIVEKIREANKQLFALESLNTSNNDDDAAASMANKKVKFALNLENNEPKQKIPNDEISTIINETSMIGGKLGTDLTISTIDEEEEIAVILLESIDSDLETPVEETASTVSPEIMQADRLKLASRENNDQTAEDVNEEGVEHICEEITSLQMADFERHQKPRNKILKQATLHFDNDYSNNESDNEMELSNSMIEEEGKYSDGEANNDEDHNTCNNGDVDDDDELSILVASYIPDNFDSAVVKRSHHHQVKPLKSYTNVSRRFPVCGSNSSTYHPPPEVTTLKFNYRMCCEYRHAGQEKLPKYTGYLSEYGLSHEQLAEKKKKMRRNQRTSLKRALEANAEELRKMHDNERAFITWLKQKMRFPPNKTRNMYDVGNHSRHTHGGTELHKCDRCKSVKKE